jgi:hypothetical protein
MFPPKPHRRYRRHANTRTVAMPISPFISTPPLRFRGLPDSLAASHLEASECCLIHADNPLSTSKPILLNSLVKVGYNGSAYDASPSPFLPITQKLTHQPGTPTQTSNPFALHARFLGARLPDKDHDSLQSNGAPRVSGRVCDYSITGGKPTSSSSWDYWTAYMSSLSRFRAQSDR